jgi:hypothetical protein
MSHEAKYVYVGTGDGGDDEHEEAPAEDVLPATHAVQLVKVWEFEDW